MRDENAIWELLELMQDISEDMWFAQWYRRGNEDISIMFWEAITQGRKVIGMARDLKEADIKKLKALHEKAGGWWAFVQLGELAKQVFMPTEDWEAFYEDWKKGKVKL